MTKITPLAGRCLIEPLEEDEVTSSGLALPEKAKEKPSKGKVVAIGSPIIHYESGGKIERIGVYSKDGGLITYFEEQSPVKKDDLVVYHKWAGQDIKDGQKEYKLVQFKDIMGVYEK